MLYTYNTPTHMRTPEKALGKQRTRCISPVSASLRTAASRDKRQEVVASAQTRSSPLADNSEKGQAALFVLSRGRKEGEVERDVIP